MTEIFLIRHAQAEGNLYRMMQGHWDGELTPAGIQQAEDLVERFRGAKIDQVYSSDLSRSRLTAAPISAQRGLEVITDARLREINVGVWETEFFANLKHRCPEEIKTFLTDPDNWSVPGSETRMEVQQRAMAAFRDIIKANEGKSVAIVSHGVTIRCILTELLDIPISDMSLPICGNTSVSRILCVDGECSIDYINDSSHLKPENAHAWEPDSELRDEVFDPGKDRDYYTSCYRDSWINAHGSEAGFVPALYLKSAIEHHKRDEGSVLKLYYGDEEAGMLELDTACGEDEGYGWISLLYLKNEFRHGGLGIQALARAIKKYTALGRSAIRLNVAESNTGALKFYKRYGFEIISAGQSFDGALYLMERKLGR